MERNRPPAPVRAGLWSLVCALVGILFFTIILGPLAVYFGWVAREYDTEDTGMGTAGFIIGVLETALIVAGILILVTR